MHKENDHAGAFLLLHGRYSVLAHYLKVSLKNSRLLKIPKLHPQKAGSFFAKVRPNGVYQGKALRRLLENACPGISACEDGQYAGLYDSAKAAKLIFEGFQPCR